MKKICIFLLLTLTFCLNGMAQRPADGKKDRMFREVREWKMKYLAQEMNLNEEQQQKFFQLYSEMSDKKDECYREVRSLERKMKKEGNECTEEDYQRLTEAMNKANLENAEIESSYDEKFAEFLSPKQVYEMKEGEKNFREKLDEMRRERKKQPAKIKR